MKRINQGLILLICSAYSFSALAGNKPNLQRQLESMFANMVVKKNISAMPNYYTRDFILSSNGTQMNYKTFYRMHAKQYQTRIQYRVTYDRKTIVSKGNKLAERIFIKYKIPTASWHKIQVILIARFRDGKIARLYELTYPNWKKAKAFKQ